MDSSAGGDGVGSGVDCGVGTIVWVRRRNGSWWPGRILGADELSASHLMSPRSGTPVKLLGREDASVDWYNLEKSKRVKAFRCGEFDACIERAEASQGAPIKKREKYARREDAILHALELEKKQLESQQQKLGTAYFASNKTSASRKNEPGNFYSPEPYIHDEHGCHRNLSSHKPQNILTKTDFSHEEDNLVDSNASKRRISKQFRWQDDNPDVIPRMRGLQDFGLRTVQSKRKSSQIVNWQNSSKPLDNHVEMLSGSGCMMEEAVHVRSSKCSMSVKKKRSQSRMVEESLIKKRDRRRPLVQVLQSSAKLAPHLVKCSDNDAGISMPEEKEHMQAMCRAKRSKCFYFPHNLDVHLHDEHDSEHHLILENQIGARKCLESPIDVVEDYVSSGLIEANGSDCSEADYLEHDMREVAALLTDTSHVLVPGSKDCEPPEFQVPDQYRRLNDNDEIPDSRTISQLHEHITMLHEHITDASAEVGVSKWHMKGKRNTRNIGKRPMDAVDGKIYSSENCNGGSMNIERTELANQRALKWGMPPNKESFYTCDEGDLIDNNLAHDQLNAYGHWSNPIKDDGRRSHSSHNDSDNGLIPSVFWEEPIEHFGPVYELEPLLVDVELKVEAGYQGEHVPLVSLMSRLNGKAIIGHPIQIEILESGSTNHLVPKFDFPTDENSAPPPVWRTARRTAMQRVPRLNPLAAAAEDEDHPDALRSKKCTSRSSQSRSRKFQKKNSKRLSLSSQKTRRLSSLATNYKLDGGSGGVELAASNDILEGLIKPEGSAPPVACVPVKVVFSRLLEAVGKPSSAIAGRVRLSSPAARDPS